MKIAYISYSIIPSHTANSVHVMKMCQAIAKTGQKVSLLIPHKKLDNRNQLINPYSFYGIDECFEIKKIICPAIKAKSIIFYIRAAMLLKTMKPDIVYTRSILAAYLASFYNKSIVCEKHIPVNNFIELLCLKYLIKYNKIKKFIVISRELQNYYLNKFPNINKLIMVLPDASDVISKNVKPKNIETSKNHITVGYTGNLYKGRGIEIILELAEKCSWAKFYIIGGTQKDISYWQKKINNYENILIYGHVPHSEIAEYLLSFDILLAPYQKQVFTFGGTKYTGGSGDIGKWMSPLKIFEYMAAGKAIIASDLPVLREILKNSINALLVPANDPQLWEQALTTLRHNPELRHTIAKQAKLDLENYYTWAKRAQLICNELRY